MDRHWHGEERHMKELEDVVEVEDEREGPHRWR